MSSSEAAVDEGGVDIPGYICLLLSGSQFDNPLQSFLDAFSLLDAESAKTAGLPDPQLVPIHLWLGLSYGSGFVILANHLLDNFALLSMLQRAWRLRT